MLKFSKAYLLLLQITSKLSVVKNKKIKLNCKYFYNVHTSFLRSCFLKLENNFHLDIVKLVMPGKKYFVNAKNMYKLALYFLNDSHKIFRRKMFIFVIFWICYPINILLL